MRDLDKEKGPDTQIAVSRAEEVMGSLPSTPSRSQIRDLFWLGDGTQKEADFIQKDLLRGDPSDFEHDLSFNTDSAQILTHIARVRSSRSVDRSQPILFYQYNLGLSQGASTMGIGQRAGPDVYSRTANTAKLGQSDRPEVFMGPQAPLQMEARAIGAGQRAGPTVPLQGANRAEIRHTTIPDVPQLSADTQVPALQPDQDTTGPKITYRVCLKSYVEKPTESNIIEESKFSHILYAEYPALSQWKNKQIARAATFYLNKGFGATLASVKATPYYHKMPQNSKRLSGVTDGNRKWAIVEQELEDFDKENRAGLTVDLIYRFEKQSSSSNRPASTTASRSIAQDFDSSHVVASNPTQTLFQEREKANSSDDITRIQDEIYGKWKCDDSRCPNNNKYCFLHMGTHYLFSVTDVKIWATHIARDRSARLSINKPPSSLIASLKKACKQKHTKDSVAETVVLNPNPSISIFP